MRRKYGTEFLETNYPISFHTPQGSGHMDGAILLATRWSRLRNVIEIGNRNTNNRNSVPLLLVLTSKMPIYAEKYAIYAHFAEICEKCGNKRNMRQSHICIKLTCLAEYALYRVTSGG